jgi:Tol biopolymer transport system component
VYWRNDANVDGGALYRAALDGSAPPAPITPGGELRDNDPAASPNGDLVAMTRTGAGIWTVGLGPGNPLKQLTAKSGDMDPSWSPDGTQITFKRDDQMWVMNADGSNDHRITKVGEIGTASAWSPR